MSSAGFPNKASKFFDQSKSQEDNNGPSNQQILSARSQNRLDTSYFLEIRNDI